MSSNFKSETARIKGNFLKAGSPHRVIKNTINKFNNGDKELMIPKWLFEERKAVAMNLPSSNKNEHFSKTFWQKLEFYTNRKVKFSIIWATRKIKSLFKIKDNVKHSSCVTYQGICSYGHNYIGETIRNVVTRIDKSEQLNGKLEPSKHLKYNPGQKSDWVVLSRAPSHHLQGKIVEVYVTKNLNSSLNDQLNCGTLILLRLGIT